MGKPSTRVNPVTFEGPWLVIVMVKVTSVLRVADGGADTETERLAFGTILVVSVAVLLLTAGLIGDIREAVLVSTPIAELITVAFIVKVALPAGFRLTSVLISPVFTPLTAQLEPLEAMHSQEIFFRASGK